MATLQRLQDDSIQILKNLQNKFPVEIELNRVAGVAAGREAHHDYDEGEEEEDEDEEEEEDFDDGIFEPKPDLGTGEQRDELLLDLSWRKMIGPYCKRLNG